MSLITWLCFVRAANLESFIFVVGFPFTQSFSLSASRRIFSGKNGIVFSHFYAMNILKWMNICLDIVYEICMRPKSMRAPFEYFQCLLSFQIVVIGSIFFWYSSYTPFPLFARIPSWFQLVKLNFSG